MNADTRLIVITVLNIIVEEIYQHKFFLKKDRCWATAIFKVGKFFKNRINPTKQVTP